MEREIIINGKTYAMVCENLLVLCFSCGKFDHDTSQYKASMATEDKHTEEVATTVNESPNPSVKEAAEADQSKEEVGQIC